MEPLHLAASVATFLAAAVAVVAFLAWRHRSRESPRDDRPSERDAIAAQVGGLLEERGRLRAERDVALAHQARQEREIAELRAERDTLQARLSQALARLESQTTLLAERDAAHERERESLRALQGTILEDQRNAFRVLGTQALQETQPQIAECMKELFASFSEGSRGELDRRHESIGALLKPLEEQLRVHQERLAQSEQSQTRALAEVRLQLEQMTMAGDRLSRETEQFRGILRSGSSRGRWGEETLRRVVEAAGLSPHCDFEEQMVAGDSRPDLVVHLPGDRHIVVDSKVPDLESLVEGQDPTHRREALAAHARLVRDTIRALSERRYPERIPGSLPDVVLFLPAESLFSAALEGDPDLLRWAAEKRILLATPSSLIALLRSVALGWQYWNQSENTRLISQTAQELMERLRVFAQHLERIHKGLETAGAAWNQASASWRSRVLPVGRRVLELGGAADATLPELDDTAMGALRPLE